MGKSLARRCHANLIATIAVLGGLLLFAPAAQAFVSVSSTASPDRTLGTGAISDAATVSGLVSPVTGPGAGTFEFRLYPPGDTTCSAPAPIFTSTSRPITLNSPGNTAGTATSADFTPTAAGTYRWRAFYSGDVNNSPAQGSCGDPGESTTVARATPLMSTNASSGVALGAGSLSDIAFVSGLVNPISGAGAGTVEFRVYGPDDASCSTAISTAPSPLALNVGNTSGTATSANFTPAAAGTYRWRAIYSGDANNQPVNGLCNEANESATVVKATPSISTIASSPITLGGQLSDSATVSSLVNPVTSGPGAGTVEFRLYGPDDAPCSTAIDTSSGHALNMTSASSGGATSANFTPTTPGTYRWRAFYSGDANNQTVNGACNTAGESTTVGKATPGISTHVTDATRTLGQSTTDTATLTFPAGSPTPTGSVDFAIYGPDNDTCSGTRTGSAAGSVNGSGVSVSDPFIPQAPGTYHWVATYQGDSNYTSKAGSCNDTDEQVVVSKATPGISTTAPPNITPGGQLSDTATVTGLISPVSGGGAGTVEFRVYGPGDPSCTNTPVSTSSSHALLLNVAQTSGTTNSANVQPTALGTYRWRAFYSGDSNNAAVSGACNDAGENTNVAKATPTVANGLGAQGHLGSPVSGDATVTGLVDPETGGGAGTVTFRLYGPDDTNCSGSVKFDSGAKPMTLDLAQTTGTSSSGPTAPTAVGLYRWVASYSGDANNAADESGCGGTWNLTKAEPNISSDAGPDFALGTGDLADSATVSGLASPITGGGAGTVEFRLYGPNDASCSGAAIFTSTGQALTLNGAATSGTATSGTFTPPAGGTYRWRAFYSGDANNASISGLCNAANEDVVVGPAPVPPDNTTPDTTPPETTITRKPNSKSHKKYVFAFESSETGSTFICSLDGAASACTPPRKYKNSHLKPGRHSFGVKAIDSAGNVDPTPATTKFVVKQK